MKVRKLSPTPNQPPHIPAPPTREQIAALAHAIWEDRGCPEGSDVDHWLEAERRLQNGARDLPVRVQDHIPAAPSEPDRDPAVDGRVETELANVVSRREPRSPTAL